MGARGAFMPVLGCTVLAHSQEQLLPAGSHSIVVMQPPFGCLIQQAPLFFSREQLTKPGHEHLRQPHHECSDWFIILLCETLLRFLLT
jgi:hypothetical protein